MITSYTSKDGQVKIEVRSSYNNVTAWALHVGGKYKGTKTLPSNNAAVVQNFGYLAESF